MSFISRMYKVIFKVLDTTLCLHRAAGSLEEPDRAGENIRASVVLV
jgi:hypothetical protein